MVDIKRNLLRIYFSFDDRDDAILSLLDEMLDYMSDDIKKNNGLIWSRRNLRFGDIIEPNVESQVSQADLIVVLLSQGYFGERFVQELELIERRITSDSSIFVIPIHATHTLLDNRSLLDNLDVIPIENSLDDFNSASDRRKIYKELLTDILDRMNEISTEFDDSSDSENQNIHIMTSVKGGVGKTLISLALMCCYLFPEAKWRENDPERFFTELSKNTQERAHGIDMNTMNTDFFKFLAMTSDKPVGGVPWRQSYIIDDNRTSKAFIRNIPYRLPKGAYGFWSELLQIIDMLDRDMDLVIDTNLHVANLIEGHAEDGTDASDMINRLLASNNNRKIFVWIFWTYASLKEPQFVENGVKSLLASSHPLVRDRIQFIHVMNPSALVAPKGDFEKQVEELARVRSRTSGLKSVIDELEEDHQRKKDLEDILNDFRQEYDEILAETDFKSVNEPLPFPGLKGMILEDPIDPISLQKFLADIGETITKHPKVKLAEIFEYIHNSLFSERGRPKNLLPVSFHDPRLRGYTDEVDEMPELQYLAYQLRYIARDVREFLDGLEVNGG